jgi:hypothetical protein
MQDSINLEEYDRPQESISLSSGGNVIRCMLTPSNLQDVANLMTKLKPEWWNLEGAIAQLNAGTGWYLESNTKPVGWLLCKAYATYRTVEIECLGFDEQGCFKIGTELKPLVTHCEQWAQEQGAVNVRFVIGSRGLSCHGHAIEKPWEELRDLLALDRAEYDWFVSMGYVPSGILPDIYGTGYHGVILLKHV